MLVLKFRRVIILNPIVKQCTSEKIKFTPVGLFEKLADSIEPLRKCGHCGIEAHIEKELDLFCKEKRGKNGRRNLCKSCNRKRCFAWGKKHPEKRIRKTKNYHATHVYKITYEEYIKRMATSDCCEVCGSKEKLGYDHCHKTLEFRGVLCNKCNRSIGLLGDTLESIQKVVTYLSRGL